MCWRYCLIYGYTINSFKQEVISMAYTTTTELHREESYRSWADAILNWQTLIALATLVLALAISAIQFGDDGFRWLLWTFTLLLLALPTLPLAVLIFKRTPQVAFPFAMAIGLLLISFSSWTLAYLHLIPFTRWGLIIVIALLILIVWLKRSNRKLVSDHFMQKGGLLSSLCFATIFVIALAAWTYVRGLMPKAEGLEKFMDYGFMMSLWRTDWLPAKDMWLAGADINYYYFGQFVYTLLSKLSGIEPAYSYNLSIASTFAYMLILSAALGWMLFTMTVKGAIRGLRKIWRILAAVLAAVFVSIAGNSHSFYYAPDGPGKAVLRWLNGRGIDVGDFTNFFFSDSTRYIGYNPEVADKTIHEFPYYSFLVADLHAHLVNTVFVLLLLGILLAYYGRKQSLLPPTDNDEAKTANLWLQQVKALWKRFLSEPTILMTGLLLAVFMMCNFWDFAIYLVVILFILMSRNIRDEAESGRLIGAAQFGLLAFCLFLPFLTVSNPLLALFSYLIAVLIAYLLVRFKRNAFSITGLQLAVIFFLAHLFSYPFNRRFEAISKTIKFTTNQSTPQQLLILWGVHILLAVISCLVVLHLSRKKTQPLVNHFLERMDGGWLVILLTVSGIGLVIAPEVIYVRDIYEGNFARANTMFKFTYQAFIMLSLIVGITVPLLITKLSDGFLALSDPGTSGAPNTRKAAPPNLAMTLIATLLVIALSIMPLYYPFVATPGWVPNPKTSPWLGLDAVAWMETAYEAYGNINGESETYDLSPDAAAINWLNEHVEGQPAIIEAAGLSYTHLNRVSAYTGLPTIMGWETHEWLWRTSKDTVNAYGEVVYPKQKDVETVYTWSDPERALEILRENKVEYIIIGELELLRYPDINLDALVDLGETVFYQGLMRIIKINPYTLG